MSERWNAAALAFLVVPAGALADTVCVDPSNPSCRPTIQQGVDAAAAGDTVAVAPGVYFENVVVPPGKDGLRIVGAGPGAVIIDPDAPRSGSGIRIRSSGVEVRELGIRNGQEYGIAIGPGLQGVVVRLVHIAAVRGPAALFADTGATGLQILSNRIDAARVGIHLSGGNNGSLLASNVLTRVGSGILASGANLQLRGNSVVGAGAFGIRLSGDSPLATNNRIEDTTGQGLLVEGGRPVVRDNRLRIAGPATVTCAFCAGGRVAGNSSLGSVGPILNSYGFRIVTGDAGLVVEDNRVSRAAHAGFIFEGQPVLVARNSATDTGTSTFGDGFLLRGPAEMHGNIATRTAASGFRIQANSSFLEGNVSDQAGVSSFLVTSPQGGRTANTVLENNQALSANAAGFALLFVDRTVLRGNLGVGNRYDLCDQASDTVLSGNRFTTISSRCDVVE